MKLKQLLAFIVFLRALIHVYAYLHVCVCVSCGYVCALVCMCVRCVHVCCGCTHTCICICVMCVICGYVCVCSVCTSVLWDSFPPPPLPLPSLCETSALGRGREVTLCPVVSHLAVGGSTVWGRTMSSTASVLLRASWNTHSRYLPPETSLLIFMLLVLWFWFD